jgi:hypothetical protein
MLVRNKEGEITLKFQLKNNGSNNVLPPNSVKLRSPY